MNNEGLNNNGMNESVNQLNIQSPPVVNEVNNNMMGMMQNEPSLSPKPKKKNNVFLGCFVLLIVLGISFAGYFIFKGNNKQLIVARSFERLQAAIVNNSKFDFMLPKIEEYLQTGKITLKAESDEETIAEIFNEYTKYNATYNLERRNDALAFEVNINKSEELLLNLKMLGEDNKLYLLAEKLFDKVIEFDYNTDILVKDDYVTIDDYLYLYDLILEKLVKNMDSSYFEKEKATIKLDDKDVSVTKTVLNLDQKKAITLSNKVLTDLRNDIRANEILNKLDESIADFEFNNEHYDENFNMNYIVYTSGLLGDVVGIDFEFIVGEENIIISYRAEELDTFYFIDQNGTNKITFKKEQNNLNIIFYDKQNKQIVSVIIKCTDANNLEVLVDINFSGAALNLTYKVNVNEITKNQEYAILNVVSVSLNMSGITATLEVRGDLNLKNVADQEFKGKFDLSKKVNYESLTDDELEKITNNLTKIFLGSGEEFKTIAKADEFKTLVKEDKLNMIVLGSGTCSWCTLYQDELNKVVNNYNVDIYYIDIISLDNEEYKQIINSDIKIPASCSTSNKEEDLSYGFGTPLTIFTKNGKSTDCISDYVEASSLVTKLKTLGMIQ